jgi:predicted XRE-type DNA-binding protein
VMTMEASSNSRDGLSSTSLQLSVEQWELLRRLRNSHLTKQQIIRAYDELDRLDRELGNLFNSASSSSSTIVPPPDPISPSTMITQQISPSSSSLSNNNKRTHSQTVNGLTSRSSSTTSNGYHSHLHHHTTSPILNVRSRNGANDIQYESNDLEEETRELQELISKGDVAIHNEISVFVYRYDLKQSQIARMASVNQAYVSKFLRGDLFDLSENGRMAICRWYIRYKKIVQSMGSVPPSAELLANFNVSCEPPTKVPRLTEPQINNNASPVSFDAPKRTRFTFRPEHLDILEKAFLDNPYPDPRRREDIARICNEARTRIDGTNELLNERDRVTDAIVTHWFQNKRKMTKSQRVSIQEDSIPSNSNHNHDFESTSGDDEVHIHHHQQQQKSNVPVVDIDCFDTPASLLDPQMAAYRAIMSRMVPFANNINGSNSLKRYVKQEPTLNQDESCHEDASDSQSPLNDRLSP